MKFLLVLAATLISSICFSQTPQTSYVVPNKNALKLYFGNANRIYVSADNESYSICSTCSANGYTVIAGAGGRKWILDKNLALNIQTYGVLPNNSAGANDTAFAAMMSSISSGNRIFVPVGNYLFSQTMTITKTIEFDGEMQYTTRFTNTGVGVDQIKINNNIQRGVFKNISLFGNGTTDYGTNATSGRGVVFGDNTSDWLFDHIWMRGHGSDYFFADNTGNLNNLTIKDSQLEWGKKGCIHLIQSNFSNQVNAIIIDGTSVSDFGETPVRLWGNSITFSKNTVQGTKGHGIVIDGSFGSTSSDASAITISNNYFELCDSGYIYAKGVLISGTYDRYLYGLSIKGNYGTYNPLPASTVDPSNISLVEIAAPNFSSFESGITVAALNYSENMFQMNTVCRAIFNGNNILTSNSVVQLSGTNLTVNNLYHINLGRATVLGASVYQGTGSPEGLVTATVGSIWERHDGGAGTALYIKESGTGNTGWTAWQKAVNAWLLSGSDTYFNTGNVAIGGTPSITPLSVYGTGFPQMALISTSGNASGGFYIVNSTPRTLAMEVIDSATAGTTLTNQAIFYGRDGLTKLHIGSSRSVAQTTFDITTGNVGINNTSPAANALLDVAGTNKGVLLPRMTTTQRDALTTTEGLLIYNLTTHTFNFYNGTVWKAVITD